MSLIHRKALSAPELAARRRNAQNSTGPRTRRGKARASLNALCHAERSERFYGFLRSFGFSPRRVLTLDRKIRGPSEAYSPLKRVLLRRWLDQQRQSWKAGAYEASKGDLSVG